MKKTKHTVLTALTFTAALQMATASNVNAVTEDEIGAIGVQTPFNAAEQEIQDVYGPAPDYYDEPTTTQIIETAITNTTTQIITTYGPPALRWTDDETTTTTPWYEEETYTTMPAPVYGPPQMFYQAGDLNGDNSVDVFDVIQMRKLLLKNMEGNPMWEEIYADVNGDNEFNIADIVAMQNYILGRVPDFVTPLKNDTTTTTSTTAPDEEPATTTTIDWSTVVPLYGPPEVLETYTYPYYTYPTTTTTNRFDVQLMYGPPISRPWDGDIIGTTYVEETTTKTTSKKPKKTTTTTSSIQTTTTTSLPEFDPIDTTVQLMYGPPEYFENR